DFISFDVGNHTLKTVKLEYPLKELQAQLKYDPDPISRLYAANAIAKKGTLEAVESLSAALLNDAFWAVRAEVAEALATIQLSQAVDGLLKGLNDQHPKVRRAVVNSLGGIKTVESYKALKSVVRNGDQSYYVEGAAATALGKVGSSTLDNGKNKENKTLNILEMVLEERAGWNEVVRSGAISGLSMFKSSEDALNLLLPYTKLGIPQALRLNAIRCLGKIAAGQNKINTDRILDRLEAIAREEFFLTQVAVVMALGQMEVSGAVRVLQGLAEQSPDGRVKRRAEEAIGRVRKTIGADKAVDELRRDLDDLKQLNRDLKSRLEALEAKTKVEKKAKVKTEEPVTENYRLEEPRRKVKRTRFVED
ncbi:MAG: aminopeptidase, partial [Leptolyngbya sp. SIO3F4]|nr:aminopeptidase [Leptolyngbya sp. SIO3F4]